MVSVLLHISAVACPAKEWSVSIYEAQAARNRLVDCLQFQPEFINSYLVTLALGQEIWTFKRIIRLEAEGQLVQHIGKAQNHMEFNALLALRWLWFPWNRYVKTSLAIGDGISYATQKPELEIRDMGDTSQYLNYLMFEIAVALPGFRKTDIFTRLHHRSAVHGMINNLSGGSNFVGFGIRYRF